MKLEALHGPMPTLSQIDTPRFFANYAKAFILKFPCLIAISEIHIPKIISKNDAIKISGKYIRLDQP